MKVYDKECRADKCKHFVLTEIGKTWASYRSYEVGKSIDDYDKWAPRFMVEKGGLVEVDDPDRVTLPGYRAVYDVYGNGKYIFDVGNHRVFHDRTMAEAAAEEFNNRPWNNGSKAFVINAVYEGKRPKPCRTYNGEIVYNDDYWSYNRPVGSLVEEEIVDDAINCVPPVCLRSDCMQCGEPVDAKIDENGKARNTFSTFSKVTEGIYKYCGNCFKGENVERGNEIPIVM